MKSSPLNELTAQDIARKKIKMQKIKDQMNPEHEAYRPGAQKKLAEKHHKTKYQIDTGKRGRPTSLRNEKWLAGTSRKSSSPVNNYKDGYYGVERKSALNMLGVQPKSPLNDMTEAENEAKAQAEMHRVASVNDRYALDITGKYDKGYDEYTDKHGYIDPDEFDKMQKTEEPKQENDADLDKFFSGIETIDNPEYADQEGAVSTEHDYFIKNRSEKSDSIAREMMNLNKQVKTLRGEKKFEEARAIQPKINDILEFIKTENENRNK